MRIFSPAFQDGQIIPSKYTCEGSGICPPLYFENIPKNAKSLVLLMDDPDVPPSVRKDQMFDHWVIFNISPTIHELKEGKAPPGIEGKNTSGTKGYFNPCPPDREHRYFFKLYALDQMLDLTSNTTKKEVEAQMEGHILEKAQMMGRYEKGKGY